MILKLSPGATPPAGDSFKIIVFMFVIGFSDVSVFQKPKHWKTNKAIKQKTMIIKLSPGGGVEPGDSLKIAFFYAFY